MEDKLAGEGFACTGAEMVGNNGTTIDRTITYLLIGIFAIVFMAFTIVGMKNVEATAEKSKDGEPAAPVEMQLDISGETK